MNRPNNVRRSIPMLTSVIALLALVLSALPVAAQEATPATSESLLAGLGYPELTITTDGTDFDVPTEIEAGRYHVVLQNDSALPADIELLQLPEGSTVDDLLAAFAVSEESGFEEIPDLFFELVFNGGPTSDPGGTGDVILDLTPGEWVFNLYTYDEESDDDTNVPKTVTVTGEMPAVEEPAGAIEIGLVEMDFQLPESIAAGPQIWKVVNNGQQPHHLALSRVPEGTTEEQVIELASTFFGPPASPEADATPAEPALSFEDVVDVFDTLIFSSGQANWLAVDLEPGTYVALCFLPDPETGMPHIMMGMVEIITVEA